MTFHSKIQSFLIVISIVTAIEDVSQFPILTPFPSVYGDDLVSSPVPAADKVVPVWPSDPPSWIAPAGNERDTTKPDGRPVADKRVIRLADVSRPEMHVYYPKGKAVSRTVVVVCPGGGYSILAWDLEGTEIAEMLSEIGVTAIALKYRVPTRDQDPRWKAPVQDIQRTISMIRSGAVEGVSADHVGVLGFSAGGNATAHAATSKKRFYEAIDGSDQLPFQPDFAVLVYTAYLVEKDNPEKLVDSIQVDDQTPPMFFAHAADDKHSCVGAIRLFLALKERSIPAALHVFSGGGHGFGGRPVGKESDAWPMLLENWMSDNGWLDKEIKDDN